MSPHARLAITALYTAVNHDGSTRFTTPLRIKPNYLRAFTGIHSPVRSANDMLRSIGWAVALATGRSQGEFAMPPSISPVPTSTSSVDAATLICLLGEARSALAHDPAGADRMIQRVATLLKPMPVGESLNLISGGLAPWQIRTTKSLVSERLAERISVEELADGAGLSASHFARAFKASLGMSPHAFVMQQRLERARALIVGTDMPLCEVALVCGFADQAHLSRLFRRVVGFSPSAWRRLNLQPEAA
jgi:AraC family transcriptional regulator